MNVGLIGLDDMGAAIARRLLQAGHAVWVWDASHSAVEAMLACGAQPAVTPQQAAQTELLLYSLEDLISLDRMFGEGWRTELPREVVQVNLCDMSAGSAAQLSEQQAQRGLRYVAASLIGSPQMAAEGLLEIFAAGSRADLRRAEAALEVLATRVHYLGTAPEQAMLAKLTAQFVRACAIETLREVEHLARASGLSAESLFVSFQRNLDLSPADTTTQTQQHEWVVEAARRNGIALPFAETLWALHAPAGRDHWGPCFKGASRRAA